MKNYGNKGAGPYSQSPIKFTDVSSNKKSATRTPTDPPATQGDQFGYDGTLSGRGASEKLPKK